MSATQVEELQVKLEKSEAARQKLRASLNLLKEKALNTGELVKQHQALQGKLAEAAHRAEQERAGREAAENALAAVRREQEGMRAEIQAVRRQAGQAARAAEEAQAQASTASRAQQAQQAELDALRRQVAGLEAQVQTLGQVLQQLQQRSPAAAAPEDAPPAPKRAKKGAPAPGTAALQALSSQLAELQGRYSSVQGEMQRWKAALGGLALLATGSPPLDALQEPPEGAEGSIMLAPVRVRPPAAVHESNMLDALDGTVDQGMAEQAWHPAQLHQPFSAASPRGLGASPAHRPLSPPPGAAAAPAGPGAVRGGGGGARGAGRQGAGAGTSGARGGERGAAGTAGGGDVRQRAAAALKAAAAEEAAAATGPAPRLKSPTKRQRGGAAAPAQQQAAQQGKQAGAGAARAPGRRVRYLEPPIAVRPSSAAGATSPAAALAATAAGATAPAAGGRKGAAHWEAVGAEDTAVLSPRPAPSLAVSANDGGGEERTVADRVAVQLDEIALPGSEPNAQVVRSAAAELAQTLVHEGCSLQTMLVAFETAVLHCAASTARVDALLPHPLDSPAAVQSAGAAWAHGAVPPAPDIWFQAPAAGEGGATTPRPAPAGLTYAAMWCSEEALHWHKLCWLLHCALRLDAELAAQMQPQGAGAPGSSTVAPALPASSGPGAPASEPAPALAFCDALRGHLHRKLVALCLGREERLIGGAAGGPDRPPGEAPALGPPQKVLGTELCALAAAAAGLCRLAGQLQAFRALLHDLLSIRAPSPALALLPLTAALEMWPEAVPPPPSALPAAAPGEGAGMPPSALPAAAPGEGAGMPPSALPAAAPGEGAGMHRRPAGALAAPAAGEAPTVLGPQASLPADIHSALQRLCLIAHAEPVPGARGSGGVAVGGEGLGSAGAGVPAAGRGIVQIGGAAGQEPGEHSRAGADEGEGEGKGRPSKDWEESPLEPPLVDRHPLAAARCLAQLGTRWWGWGGAGDAPVQPACPALPGQQPPGAAAAAAAAPERPGPASGNQDLEMEEI